MSASLVGSEMCIRDRSEGCPEVPDTRPERSMGYGRQRAGAAPNHQPQTCLLYTSDAADDM
eukprot:13793125-Alexandrium_andersonii.AAC.1